MFSKTELSIIAGWFIAALLIIFIVFGILTITTVAIIIGLVLFAILIMHSGVHEFTSGFSDTEKSQQTNEYEEDDSNYIEEASDDDEVEY